MSSLNPHSFLFKKVDSMESIDIEGKENGFERFLKEKQLPISNEYWSVDHSIINWKVVDPFFQFNFDNQNKDELSKWLLESKLSEFDYLYTWLNYQEPIIKIKTQEFIENWENLNVYVAWEGLVLTTKNGELFLEFTDDWKTHLNSNFKIKP